MTEPLITGTELEAVLEYRASGLSYAQLAKRFLRPKATIFDTITRHNNSKLSGTPKEVTAPTVKKIVIGSLENTTNKQLGIAPEDDPDDLGEYDSQLVQFFDWIGKTQNAYKPNDGTQTTENYLVATDWHIPWHNKEKVGKAVLDFIAKFGKGSLIIGGDFIDGYELNSYSVTKGTTLKEEMAAARLMLEWLSSVFETIVLIDDNHMTGRWRRMIAKQLSPSVQEMFAGIDPYTIMIKDLPNVRLARKTYKNGAKIGWFHVVGDCLIAHAETHSAVAMKPVMNVMAYFDHARKRLGIPEIRCYMEAHVHKLGGPYFVPGRDIAVYETGCLAAEEAVDYGWDASLKYKPIENGVVHLVQHDGVTDHNETRVVRYPD